MGKGKNITAANANALEEILRAAMYSCSGRIIYDKWNRKDRRFEKRSHVVVPIDCGVTSRKNPVLYAVDVEDGMQLKAFIIRQIRDFKNYHEKVKVGVGIQVDNIKAAFGIDDFKFRLMQEGENGMAAGMRPDRNLVARDRTAQEIYEFSGCEGHLYSDSKGRDPYSYNVVGDDGRDKASRIAMRILLGANPFAGVKVQALNFVLNRNDITSSNMNDIAVNGTDAEKEAFQKCTAFFTDANFKPAYKSVVPEKPEVRKFYDPIYNGVLKFLGTPKFGEFFDGKFDVEKINASGRYEGFRESFNTTHFVGRINDILNTSLFGIVRKLSRNENAEHSRNVNNAIQDFQKGTNGERAIDALYDKIKSVVNELGGTAEENETKRQSDAWSSIGSPVKSNGRFNCYCVRRWDDLNAVAGNTGWCVAQNGQSGRNYFDGDSGREKDMGYIHPNYDEDGNPTRYIHDRRNAYYLICDGRKPVALMNISKDDENQFKDVDDNSYEFDRPTSKDVVALAYEVREYIGSDSYDGDFEIFEEYEKTLEGGEIEIDFGEGFYRTLVGKEQDRMREYLRIPEVKEHFLLNLSEGMYLEYGVVSKHPDMLDEFPEVGKAMVDGYSSNPRKLPAVIKDSPELVERSRYIRDFFVGEITVGNDAMEAVMMNNLGWIDTYSDIRDAFVAMVRVMGITSVFDEHPFLLDTYKDNEEMTGFFAYCIENGNGFYALGKHPDLMDGNPLVGKAIGIALRKGHGIERLFEHVVMQNPELVDSHRDVLEALVERMDGNLGHDSIYYGVLEKDPSLVQRHPEIKKAFVSRLGNCDAFKDLLTHCKGSVLKQLDDKDMLDEIIERVSNGNGTAIDFIAENPSIVESHMEFDDAIAKAMDEDRFSDIYMIIKKVPSLIGRSEAIRRMFIGNLEIGKIRRGTNGILDNAFSVVDENPSLLNDNEIRIAFFRGIENGKGSALALIRKSVAEFEKYPEFDSIVCRIVGNGGSRHSYDFIEESPEFVKANIGDGRVVSQFVKLISMGRGFVTLFKDVSLIDESEEIGKAFLDSFENFSRYASEVVRRNPQVLETHPDIFRIVCEKRPVLLVVLKENEWLLWKYGEIRDALVDAIENGSDDERKTAYKFFVDNFSLMEQSLNDGIVDGILSHGLQNDCIPFDFFTENSRLFLKHTHLLETLTGMSYRHGIEFSRIIAANPSLVDGNQSVADAISMCILRGSICSEFKGILPELANRSEKIRNAFIEAVSKKGMYENLIEGISDFGILKKIIDSADDDDEYYIFKMALKNRIVDEGKLYSLCKKSMPRDMDLFDFHFFGRFSTMSESEEFQDDFWKFVEENYDLYKVLKNHFAEIPKARLEKFAKSSDEDISWFARNVLERGVSDMERRASRIAKRIVALLSPSQKSLTEHFTSQRRQGLSFGDYFKWDSNGRCYVPLKSGKCVKDISKIGDPSTNAISGILDSKGYVCPDYSTGYCYRKSDGEFKERHPKSVVDILKSATELDRDRISQLEKAFAERRHGALRRLGNVRMMMCITHNPEDIAGMSTDRDWASCMRLPFKMDEITEREIRSVAGNYRKLSRSYKVNLVDAFCRFEGILGRKQATDFELAREYGIPVNELMGTIYGMERDLIDGGEYHTTALKQVKYGGMVAYLIREDDRGIDKPYARIAIKRLENSDGGFKFVPEGRVYGIEIVAEDCDFAGELKRELDRSNAATMKGDSEYGRNDGNSWSDSNIDADDDIGVDRLCRMDWRKVYGYMKNANPRLSEDDLARIVDAHVQAPPMGLFELFEKRCGSLSEEFVDEHADMMDIDKWNLEHGVELVPSRRYEEGDAPRDELEMNGYLVAFLEELNPGDDYGEVSEIEDAGDHPTFRGELNPIQVEGNGTVPAMVRNYASNRFRNMLMVFYKEDASEKIQEMYPTFALFEEAYDNWLMPDAMRSEVSDYVSESLSWEELITYRIVLIVEDIVDGYESKDSVFTINGVFQYELPYSYHGIDNIVVAYDSTYVVNTEDDGWKDKVKAVVKDMYDQLPSIY